MKLHTLLSTRKTRSLRSKSRRLRQRKLAIESLESRRLLTAGELDLTFGNGGRVLTDIGHGLADFGNGVAAYQSNGKFVVAGGTDGGDGDFAVVRYIDDGSLDTSFGIDGIVKIDFGGFDSATGVAVDDSDRILVSGVHYGGDSSESEVAVARLTSSGVLDTAFDVDGKQTIDFDGLEGGASVAVDSLDRVLVVGAVGRKFAVARLTTSGALDPSFDTDGKQTFGFGTFDFGISTGVAVDSVDRVLVAGYTSDIDDHDFAVARLTTDGALDPSFDSDGKQTVDFGDYYEVGAGVAIDSADRVLVAGFSADHFGIVSDFAVARLTTGGALDPSFGTDGKQTVDFGSTDYAYGVAVDSLDQVVVAGSVNLGGTGDFAVVRFTSGGELDPSFSEDGKQTVDFGDSNDEALSVAVDSAGRVLLAGYSYQDETGFDFAVARLVNSSPPVSDAGGPYEVDEGTPHTLDGSGSTDDGVIVSYEWDLDYDGMTFDADLTTTGATISHTFADDFSGNIALRVTDTDGESDIDSASLTVTNVDPHDVEIAAGVGELVFAVGSSQPFSGSFEDVGTLDTHTAVWTFTHSNDTGVTITETRDGNQGSGSGTVSNSFSFAEAGVYQVTLTITDDDAGMTSSLTSLFVVYDPSAGFVTGGGWINSPAGAYSANTALTGKATFGFVSKYNNGNNVPTGNTEFQFKVADFNFKSTSYEWLVVSGAKARFRGVGAVNGTPGYGFELTAWDGQVNGAGGADKFRIKIWLGNQGNGVVYDNMMDDPDGADPITALGGGSIVIHKSGNNLVLDAVVGGAQSGEPRLDDSQLSMALADAVGQWAAQGLSSSQIQHLQRLQVVWADLPGNTLGLASASTNYVWIDRDAAGYGWSLSSTAPERGRVDLFSTLTHELGHVLGYDHDVLGEFLQVGERHVAMLAEHQDHDHSELGTPLTHDAGLLGATLRHYGDSGGDSLFYRDPVRPSSRAAMDLLDQALADWTQGDDWAVGPAGYATRDSGRGLTEREEIRPETDESLDDNLLAELAVVFSK